jgi:REP element-mobilizing transposase RayT
MRTARIVEEGAAFYHVISRVVDRRFVFQGDVEREGFRKIMRAVEGFTGVRILTWVCMSNHFHVLLHVAERAEVGDSEFIRRMKFLYDGTKVETLAAHLAGLRESGQHQAADEVKAPYVRRMNNLAEFMKSLKQRVSIWHNKRNHRVGTLWEDRYKSVLVDGSAGALMAMAAYIDLNPVRAGMVKDPKDYRHSGYGEAMGGSPLARAGLGVALGESGDWRELSARYRQLLYVSGEARGVTAEGRAVRPGFSAEAVDAVVAVKGKLPLNEILRCRVRYFTDGAILGSRAFVEEAFLRHRGRFSERRKDGARAMKGAEWGDLFAARALRVEVIAAPPFPG